MGIAPTRIRFIGEATNGLMAKRAALLEMLKALRGPKSQLQYAALPYRVTADGLEVLLITSREQRRWIVPKGWPLKGKAPFDAAAREALEEAGVVGKVGQKPLGAYNYEKTLKNGEGVPCKVEVFPLRVITQKRTWPERHQRSTQWFPWNEAASAVQEPGLAKLIRRFSRAAKVSQSLREAAFLPDVKPAKA